MRLLMFTLSALAFLHVPNALACDLKSSKAPPDSTCRRQWFDENLHLNDLLSVGTHNSYKLAIPEKEMAALRKISEKAAVALDYSHRPLTEELDDGARQLELDVFYDPEGGRYADPLGPRSIGERIEGTLATELKFPGFKVMHSADVDFRATCSRFTACLREIKRWSDAHPDHVPILILINAKEGKSLLPGGVTILKFDAAAFDALDAEIASVLSADLITPDVVQGKFPTLRAAVLAGNWPKLRQARGKILIALDEGPEKVALYRGERKSLEGRKMFINTDEASPAAAYLTLNEPTDLDRIHAAVQAGFLVRTRADADTVEARSNTTARRDNALVSGAQYVSTDYMQPDLRFGPYTARMPEGTVAVCNPVRAGDRCGTNPIVESARRR